MNRFALLSALLLAACGGGLAAPDVKATDGWTRETAAGQTSAAAYLSIVNNGTRPDRLVGVSSDVAAHTMLHSTESHDGVARMRPVDNGLKIPSKTAVELTPGLTHIMLAGLTQPLKRGQHITVTLKFEKSGEKQAIVKVLDPTSAGVQEGQ